MDRILDIPTHHWLPIPATRVFMTIRHIPSDPWLLRCLKVGEGERVLSIQLIAFEPGRLPVDAFDVFGIAMPPSIVRSVAARKEEFFYGRIAARHALAAVQPTIEIAARIAPSWPVIGMGAQREPLWPPGFVGSITHCSGLAAAAVAPDHVLQGLGIDMERIVGPEARDALMQVAMDSVELECIRVASARRPFDVLLTAAFSAKESFYKGVFSAVGRFFGFEAIRLRAIDEERQRMSFTIMQSLAAPFSVGDSFEIDFVVPVPGVVLTYFVW